MLSLADTQHRHWSGSVVLAFESQQILEFKRSKCCFIACHKCWMCIWKIVEFLSFLSHFLYVSAVYHRLPPPSVMYQSLIATCNINAVVVLPSRLTAGDLSVQLNFNDYLDIYCPHYPNEEAVGHGQPETLALYLVGEESFQGCVETRGAIKRWECNTPFAPFGPVRFSEKIQRFTPFSLGFEFLPGRHYYYSCE